MLNYGNKEEIQASAQRTRFFEYADRLLLLLLINCVTKPQRIFSHVQISERHDILTQESGYCGLPTYVLLV